MNNSTDIYEKYLQYKEDMFECKEEQIKYLSLDDFIDLKLYRDKLTAKRGCYRMSKKGFEKVFFWKQDPIFCSFVK